MFSGRNLDTKPAIRGPTQEALVVPEVTTTSLSRGSLLPA
jgi:hypothetical protein